MDGTFWKTVLNNEETQHTMKITPVNYLRYYQSPKGDESEPERGDGGDSPHPTRPRGEQRRTGLAGRVTVLTSTISLLRSKPSGDLSTEAPVHSSPFPPTLPIPPCLLFPAGVDGLASNPNRSRKPGSQTKGLSLPLPSQATMTADSSSKMPQTLAPSFLPL